MATGDSTDISARLAAALPPWFGDDPANLKAEISGTASLYAYAYALYLFAAMQTRLKSASGPFLDLISLDFFDGNLPRKTDESDSSYLARITANLFRPKGTRAALISALEAITGYTPKIYEPFNSTDTGGYGANCGAGYGVGGAYGSSAYPYQCWCTVYRNPSSGLEGNGGYGTTAGAYGVPSAMHYQASKITDADQGIFDAVEAIKLAGTIVWLSLQSPPSETIYLVDETNGYVLTDEGNGFQLIA